MVFKAVVKEAEEAPIKEGEEAVVVKEGQEEKEIKLVITFKQKSKTQKRKIRKNKFV